MTETENAPQVILMPRLETKPNWANLGVHMANATGSNNRWDIQSQFCAMALATLIGVALAILFLCLISPPAHAHSVHHYSLHAPGEGKISSARLSHHKHHH